MSGWTVAHQAIKEQLVGKTGVRVLVVEGDGDRAFFEAMLDQIAEGQWEEGWVVGSAEGKSKVRRILDAEPDWLGIVDRDEWSKDAAEQAATAHGGRLLVLPRFCMESYFLRPDELWSALEPVQQERINGGRPAFDLAIGSDIDPWVRHGALWHAVNPLWDGLHSIGFKDDLLKLEAAQDDELIRSKLAEWHNYLTPETTITKFESLLTEARMESDVGQLTQWIHGKRRFTEHTVPKLNSLMGQRSAIQWLEDLRKTLPIAPDLNSVWQAMGLTTTP